MRIAVSELRCSLMGTTSTRSEEHTSELQSRVDLVCRHLLEKKKEATPFNQILKQNAKREMRLRLGKVTVSDVWAAQPVTTNLLKFMRASIKIFFLYNTPTTMIYTLYLQAALPI